MADQVQVSYDELVQRYGKAVADNIVSMLDQGVSPTLIRELDPWTGVKHWEYAMPYPTGNINIWQVPVNEQGQAEPDKAIWVGPAPPPGPPPTAQDLQKPASTGGVSVKILAQSVSVPEIPLVAPGEAKPGASPTGATTSAPPPPPPPTEEKKMADASLDDLIIARAGGDNYYSWDEWNWFYEQVTGQPGPAPEDRGLARNAAGDVVINGSARYNYATWKKYAFPSGFGGEAGKAQPAATGLLAQVEHLLKMLLAFLIGGKRV